MLLLLSMVLAAEPGSDPVFEAHAARSEPAAGVVEGMDTNWDVRFGGDIARTIEGSELISLRQKKVKLPPPPTAAQVVFANGDRLPGRVHTITAGKVQFQARISERSGADELQELTVPLNSLAVIWFVPPPETMAASLVRVLRERRRRDVVVMHNGDLRQGTVQSLSAEGKLRLKEAGDDREIEASHVLAIALNTDLARALKPRGAFGRVILLNGARLSLLTARADSRVLTGRTLFAADFKAPWQQIAALDIRQGPAVYLSDLKPRSYSHKPFLAVAWPYTMDRSVGGGGLRLGGDCYDKGVSLHSESRISFALDGKYRRFESFVGLNDNAGSGGNVRIRVQVDGREKDCINELNSANGPKSLRVDVQGANNLTLVVEFGSGGDVRDHVDWANARLIK